MSHDVHEYYFKRLNNKNNLAFMWNIKPLNILMCPEITSLIKCFSTELIKINYHEKSI